VWKEVELRRSAENNSKDFIVVVVGNRHDLSPGLDVPEKNSFWFAFWNEFLGNFLKPQFKGNFIINLSKTCIESKWKR